MALVALGGLVSCWVAGNKRIAVNATVDWLCLPLLTIVLVQLLRQRWHLRLVLCVVLSSAAVQAYECFNQVFYSFPATKEFYDQFAAYVYKTEDGDKTKVAEYLAMPSHIRHEKVTDDWAKLDTAKGPVEAEAVIGGDEKEARFAGSGDQLADNRRRAPFLGEQSL